MAITDDPARFGEAVHAFRKRVPMVKGEWEDLDAEAQERAFTVAQVAQADLVTQVWEAIDRAIEQGTTLDEFKEAVGPQLRAAWGTSVASPAWRLETIFRTNVQNAYGAGSWHQRTRPAVLKARPFWMFDGIEDSRQTPTCQAISGTVRPADDPWWRKHQPPLHFNCRSTIVALDPEEAADLGVDDKAPPVPADEGFGRAPTVGGYEPDLHGYPGPIADVLREGSWGNTGPRGPWGAEEASSATWRRRR